MPSVIYDLGYIQAGIDSLDDFLLSKNLFWPLTVAPPIGESPFPRLTLGGLLLSLTRLHARELIPSQRAKLNTLEFQYGHISYVRRGAWQRKGRREFLSRLRQWRIYLQELRQTPADHVPYYGNEVRTRVIMDLLIKRIDPLTNQYLDELSVLDTLLGTILDPKGFIWDPELIEGFPSKTFWYLWGQPKILDLDFN